MIRIFPTEKFTITTHLQMDRVENQLSSHIEPVKLDRVNFPFSPAPSKPYEGWVENDCFQLQKISRNNNRYTLPIVEGKIFSEDRGSLIEIKIKPNENYNRIMLFLALLYIPVIIIMGFDIWSSIQDNTREAPIFFLFFPFWMGVVYFIAIIKFKSQMRKDKKFLLEIFN
ncbi:MAG: hypothetical protein AAFQ91_23455 [Cyanobacteria bacterium J06621_15]